MNSSSACVIGQRRSSSEWMSSIGTSMSRTCAIGDSRMYSSGSSRCDGPCSMRNDVRNVTAPLLRQHVVDRPLAADRPEASTVSSRQQGRHVAAVAAAEHADAVAVAEAVAIQRGVDHGENVVDVDGAPAGAGHRWVLGAEDRLAPRRISAAAATGVAHHHDEPGGGLHLGLVEERLAVLRERPAVHVEQHRVLASGFEALRPHDPGVDLVGPVGGGHAEALPAEEAARHRGDRTVQRDDLGWVLDRRLGHRDAAARSIERRGSCGGHW